MEIIVKRPIAPHKPIREARPALKPTNSAPTLPRDDIQAFFREETTGRRQLFRADGLRSFDPMSFSPSFDAALRSIDEE